VSLEGFENFATSTYFQLFNNDALISISALESLTVVIDLYVDGNDSLINFEGLEQVTSLSSLWITNNSSLESLNGLQNITTIITSTSSRKLCIGYRPVAASFTGTVGPAPNPNLVDLCGLQNLFTNGNGSEFQITIENNPINPTIQDFIDGNCSQ